MSVDMYIFIYYKFENSVLCVSRKVATSYDDEEVVQTTCKYNT